MYCPRYGTALGGQSDLKADISSDANVPKNNPCCIRLVRFSAPECVCLVIEEFPGLALKPNTARPVE